MIPDKIRTIPQPYRKICAVSSPMLMKPAVKHPARFRLFPSPFSHLAFLMALVLTRRLQPLRGMVDLAPVVNVVLLLLCFFLLSSSFVLQPGIKVDPPRSAVAVGTPASRLIVAVAMAPQQYDDKGAPMKRQPILYFNDQIVTLDGLRTALDQLPEGRITPSLVVKADKDVPVDLIASIIDVASRFPVVIATQPMTGASPQ